MEARSPFLGQFMRLCACSRNSNFIFWLGSYESFDGRKSAESLGNVVIYSEHAPKTPLQSAVYGREPNFSLPNPPYFLDLAPCEFCLCPRLTNGLKIHRFSPVDEIQKKASAGPTTITNMTSRFSSADGSTAVASVYVQKCSTV